MKNNIDEAIEFLRVAQRLGNPFAINDMIEKAVTRLKSERITKVPESIQHYSQGVCEDGAAILCDGERMTVDEIVSTLNVQEKLFESYKSVVDAIPECPAHGPCVPHCLDWIEAAKRRKR